LLACFADIPNITLGHETSRLGPVRKRDWAGTIVVAALIALASFLHAHVIAVVLLAVVASGALSVVAFDIGQERGVKNPRELPRRRPADSQGSISAAGNIRAGGDVRAWGDVTAGESTLPASWLDPADLGSYLDQINKTMEEKGFGQNPGPLLDRPGHAQPPARSLSWDELNEVRVGKYAANRGLFLVHSWKPSSQRGQVADVVISVAQHQRGPLTEGTISGVQYTLGPMFSTYSHVITDPQNGFATSVSMFGPMLCLAEICFQDGSPPLILERYIDFDGGHA
jgi:hypothetical protein